MKCKCCLGAGEIASNSDHLVACERCVGTGEDPDIPWFVSMTPSPDGKVVERQRCDVGCAPICTSCHRRKNPIGRSAAPEMANGLCDLECAGYRQDPTPCDLWPGEKREDFGY